MGSIEIQSPESVPERSQMGSAGEDGKGIMAYMQRKKLGIHFAESDERQFPKAMGGEYVSVGTTPVNIRGKPIEDLSKTGGWIAAFFIFGNEMAERMAYFGLSVNMVTFMFYIMHRPFTSSANVVNNFLGISQASSVLGGFLADAYLVGAIVAFTMVVYIQMEHGWGSAFGSLALAMGISNAVFFVGTPLYRHRLPGGSPFTRVAQVLVAAFRKRNIPFSSSDFIGLYELPGKRSAIKGSEKIEHTNDFRCLDKAALQLKEDGTAPSPWRLCTVTQVEEVKILLKLLPIPSCTIMLSVILTEFLTLSVQQAYTLNTHLGHLKLPVTCMPVFPGLSIFLILALYYSTFAPVARRITGHPQGASQLQRVGLGLVISILSVAWAGVFERYRRNYAIEHGFQSLFLSPMPNLSAYWLLIQYCLIGIAEVFCIVALLEFLYQEAPDAMRSIGSAYAAVAGGLGCFVATILNNIINSITGNEAEGRSSWLAQNINTGRFDYLYWLLAGLSIINFCAFLFFAKRYKYRVRKAREMEVVKGNKDISSSEGK
ncbi:protein NRT1/ PTR FAMILY 6.1 isoform X3 [Typha latifolia]|uniref:protein NRT1/ PTR FAMILY 6.1 isoform X3 n=1 Tax=Typha latifolia TaxID=4733 RepID=UPI003C2F76E6